MLLDGEVVIVSGVGPALGKAIAQLVVREGGRVAAVARDGERLRRGLPEIGVEGVQVVAVPADIESEEECLRVADTVMETFGRIDGLVNNAVAYGDRGPIMGADIAGWAPVFALNVIGTMHMSRAVVRHMLPAGTGSVVMVNSMVTRKFGHEAAGYAASKGALATAASELASEVGPSGIRVNSVVLGWMLGPRVEELFERQALERGVSAQDVMAEISSRSALRKIPTLEECSYPIVFLLSSKASGITGQAINVSAGEVMS